VTEGQPTPVESNVIRANAEQRATALIADMNARTQHIGGVARNQVMTLVLTEALTSSYLEGRSSTIVDRALREAKEARDNELQSAKNLIAQGAVQTQTAASSALTQFASTFASSLVTPISKTARTAIWWIIGLGVAHAVVITALAMLLLRK